MPLSQSLKKGPDEQSTRGSYKIQKRECGSNFRSRTNVPFIPCEPGEQRFPSFSVV